MSATLYEKRFGSYFCQPVIAGLEPDGTPYLCGMDSIGAVETAKDFMIAGTASDALLGICESLWRPDMVRLGSVSVSGTGAQRCSVPWGRADCGVQLLCKLTLPNPALFETAAGPR